MPNPSELERQVVEEVESGVADLLAYMAVRSSYFQIEPETLSGIPLIVVYPANPTFNDG